VYATIGARKKRSCGLGTCPEEAKCSPRCQQDLTYGMPLKEGENVGEGNQGIQDEGSTDPEVQTKRKLKTLGGTSKMRHIRRRGGYKPSMGEREKQCEGGRGPVPISKGQTLHQRKAAVVRGGLFTKQTIHLWANCWGGGNRKFHRKRKNVVGGRTFVGINKVSNST